MKQRVLPPILRDAVFLTLGSWVFVHEAMGQARWIPMVLGMLFASGPAAVLAYWGRTPANGSSVSSPPVPSPPSSPSLSPSAGGDEP